MKIIYTSVYHNYRPIRIKFLSRNLKVTGYKIVNFVKIDAKGHNLLKDRKEFILLLPEFDLPSG
jgi:hypothetical protein